VTVIGHTSKAVAHAYTFYRQLILPSSYPPRAEMTATGFKWRFSPNTGNEPEEVGWPGCRWQLVRLWLWLETWSNAINEGFATAASCCL